LIIEGGYFITARKLLSAPLAKSPVRLKVMLILISDAEWRTGQRLPRGSVQIKFDPSDPAFEGITRPQWQRSLSWLRDKGTISTTKLQHGAIHHITRYNEYQNAASYRWDQPEPGAEPTEATYRDRPGLKILHSYHKLKSITTEQFDSTLELTSDFINQSSAAKETITYAKAQARIRDPQRLVVACFKKYHDTHKDESRRRRERYEQEQQDIASIADAMVHFGDDPERPAQIEKQVKSEYGSRANHILTSARAIAAQQIVCTED